MFVGGTVMQYWFYQLYLLIILRVRLHKDQKKQKKSENTDSMPLSIDKYNSHMGGVDKLDQLLAYPRA